MANQSISTYFQADHDRLDQLFKKFQELKSNNWIKAKELFMEFKAGMERHIIWEEDILFPLFEEKTERQCDGPVVALKAEHSLIMQYLKDIAEKVNKGNTETEPDELSLTNTLFLHDQKEENIFYPAIDSLLSDAERESVFATMGKNPSTWIRL